MSVADNCAKLRRFMEVAIPALDTEEIDRVVHADVILPEDMHGTGTGVERFKSAMALNMQAFEMTIEVQDIFGVDDKVVSRQVAKGRHTGAFMGIEPTGKEWAIDEIIIARFRDGKVAQFWRVADIFALMSQLGLAPAQGAAAEA